MGHDKEAQVGVPDDATIAAGVRRWVDQLARGTYDDREALTDWIEEAEVSGFPAEVGVTSLSQLPARTLWKTFEDDALQDLYDLAYEMGLDDVVAENFKAAALARPYIDSGKVPSEVFKAVMKRDDYHCQHPGCDATEHLTIDHKIVPWSEGGSSTDLENLQVLCRSCNSRKGTRPWVAPVES
jgi:hypothetical protein